MIGKFGHVSVERVCSGSGIPNIYDCVKENGRFPEPEWLQKAFAEAISKQSLDPKGTREVLSDSCD